MINEPSRGRPVPVTGSVVDYSPRVKVYRLHHCAANHRTERTFLQCAIPRLAWVAGSGSYALIAWCKVPTVTLYPSLADALEGAEVIATGGCGGRCRGRHEVVYVDLEAN